MMKSFKLRRAVAPRLIPYGNAPHSQRVLQILQLFGDPAPVAADQFRQLGNTLQHKYTCQYTGRFCFLPSVNGATCGAMSERFS